MDGYWLDPYLNSIPLIWQFDDEFAQGFMIIRTKDEHYLSQVKNLINKEKLAIEIHNAQSASAIKSERLIREKMLFFTLTFVTLTILLAVFFILATAIHNIVITKTVEIKVSLALGATRRRVCFDTLHSCYAVLLGSLFFGGAFSVAVVYLVYPTVMQPLLFVFSALLFMLLLFIASSANQIRRVYQTSPLDLFKDN